MNNITQIQYDLMIEPNLTNFIFVGKAKMHMTCKEQISSLVLNGMELTINSCELTNGESKLNIPFKIDYNLEEIQLDFPKKVSGNFSIEFNYIGKIKNNLKGLYQTKYKIGDTVHIGAITQFETEDARRLFPCFDEPGMKASFNVGIIADNDLTLISNMPILSEDKLDNGKKIVKFEKTPKMSTYLLMIGMAHFESIQDKLGNIEIKVITHPNLSQYAKFSLDFSKKTLDFCQNYFDIPYPLPKLDLVATPDFAPGAMENWGAIVFRENLLLNYPGYTTNLDESYILMAIAHEITHQWFGNIVSPSIWKYIWLNESFANFFGFKIANYFYPERHLWELMVITQINGALIADGYNETVPIEIKEQKKTSYNIKSIPIIYSKGGAIIRMIEEFIGTDFFQKGLHLYLTTHSYDVASSEDLWIALEEASNKPISKIMKSWVLQIGYPLISVFKEGNNLIFNQERFTYLDNNDLTIWEIPITVQIFSDNKDPIKKKFLLKEKQGTLDIGFPFTAFKVNSDQFGFYRVKYSQSDLDMLGTLVKTKKLSPLDCWTIINDLFALVRSGKIDLNCYLKFVTNFTSTNFYSSIKAISDHLFELHTFAEGEKKQLISDVGIKFHKKIFDEIKYEPQKNESPLISNIRNSLLLNAGNLESRSVISFCLQEFDAYKKGKIIPPEIKDAILSISARYTNDINWFINSFDKASNEIEIINLAKALGEFSEDDKINRVLNEILFTKIPMRNIDYVINRLCHNPNAIGKMWEYYIANLDNFGKLHEYIQSSSINNIVSYSVDPEIKKDMEEFFADYGKTNPVAQITTEKAFETLTINMKLKNYLK